MNRTSPSVPFPIPRLYLSGVKIEIANVTCSNMPLFKSFGWLKTVVEKKTHTSLTYRDLSYSSEDQSWTMYQYEWHCISLDYSHESLVAQTQAILRLGLISSSCLCNSFPFCLYVLFFLLSICFLVPLDSLTILPVILVVPVSLFSVPPLSFLCS